jgi:lipopolysaccharide transport system ATP-binding protein
VDVRILDRSHHATRAFRPGESILIQVRAVFHQAVTEPVVGLLIRNRIGMDVFGTNTRLEGVALGNFDAGETLQIEFEMDCLLSRQEYTVTVATQYANGLSQDWLDDVLDFEVVDSKDVAGVLNLNTRVRFSRLAALADAEGSGIARK